MSRITASTGRRLACGALAALSAFTAPPAAAEAACTAAVALDGSIGVREWAGARRIIVGAGVEGMAMRDAQAVYFAFRTDSYDIGHAYLGGGGEVLVLHASGSLGSAVYSRAGDGWTLRAPFAWELRDPAIRKDGHPSPDGHAREQAAHWQRQGWVAATAMMGTRGESEMKVSLAKIRQAGGRVAFGWFSGPDGTRAYHHLPAGATVGAEADEARLFMGEAPATADLSPSGWWRPEDIPCAAG